MRDEEYGPEQIADYGVRAQPSIVARMTPHLRMTQLGNGFAVLAIATSIAALVTFPSFSPGDTGSGWAVTALVCSVAMLLICGFQLTAWLRGMGDWKGERDLDLSGLMRVSWVAHVVSYVVVVVGLYACIAGSGAAGWSSVAALLLALTLMFLVAAQVLAGVQYLRVSGPPGTIPTYIRRLARIQR